MTALFARAPWFWIVASVIFAVYVPWDVRLAIYTLEWLGWL